MKKIYSRLICVLLCTLICLTVFISCSNPAVPDGETTSEEKGTSVAPGDTTANSTELETRNMTGQEMNVWYSVGYVWNPYPLDNGDVGFTGDIIKFMIN